MSSCTSLTTRLNCVQEAAAALADVRGHPSTYFITVYILGEHFINRNRIGRDRSSLTPLSTVPVGGRGAPPTNGGPGAAQIAPYYSPYDLRR